MGQRSDRQLDHCASSIASADNQMAQKILLTGGAGYIGSHTYVALIEAGFEVVILDNFSISNPSVLIRLGQITRQNQVICYEGSVLDKALLAQIFTEHDISAVIHFAALKAVGESVEQPLAYFSTNITGLLCLLETMKPQALNIWCFPLPPPSMVSQKRCPSAKLLRCNSQTPMGSPKSPASKY